MAERVPEFDTRASEPGKGLGLASVPNLRDVGGYATTDGRVVRRGLAFRSDQLNPVAPGDMSVIEGLGLSTVVDLRSAEEAASRPDQLPPGVTGVRFDVLADTGQSGAALVPMLLRDPARANAEWGERGGLAVFEETYRQLVSLQSARTGYRALFQVFADRAKLPVLFHCTAGKDRTGWAAAALLSALGVPRGDVVADFLESNDVVLGRFQWVIDAFVAGGGNPQIPAAIFGARAEYLDAAFDEALRCFGSIDGYLSDGLGIDVASLRDVFLESA
jgi:protein-tyrosine phosphatase